MLESSVALSIQRQAEKEGTGGQEHALKHLQGMWLETSEKVFRKLTQ